MDPDPEPICPERFDPDQDPVCPERFDPVPDPDPKPCLHDLFLFPIILS